jgi:hypothetical protein
MLWVRNLFAYAVCAIASVGLVRWIDSTLVADTLIPNLTTIVVALLAINVQTTAVISTKLREIVDKNGVSFRGTVRQFKLAIMEQVALTILSLVVSALVKTKIPLISPFLSDGLAFFTFYASLHIFIDTTVGMLIAIFPED